MHTKINARLVLLIIVFTLFASLLFLLKYSDLGKQTTKEIAKNEEVAAQKKQIPSKSIRNIMPKSDAQIKEENIQKEKEFFNEQITSKIEQHREFPDTGITPQKGSGFIYSTKRYFGFRDNGSPRLVDTFYIRSVDGEFNKRLFYRTSGMHSFELMGGEKMILTKYGFSSGTNYFIDFKGNVKLLNDEEELDVFSKEHNIYEQELVSPDGNFIARRNRSGSLGIKDSSIIEIHNILTGENTQYDFEKYGYPKDIHINSWKPDSKSVYVASGTDSLAYPANLWRIDIGNPNPYKYNQFDGLVNPISIYPKENLAFVRDEEPSRINGDMGAETSLYTINLLTGEKKRVLTEDSRIRPVYAFHNSKIFYTLCKDAIINGDFGETCDMYYLNLLDKTKHLFIKNISFDYSYLGYDSKRVNPRDEGMNFFIFVENENFYLTNLDKLEKVFLGKREINYKSVAEGAEFLDRIEMTIDF